MTYNDVIKMFNKPKFKIEPKVHEKKDKTFKQKNEIERRKSKTISALLDALKDGAVLTKNELSDNSGVCLSALEKALKKLTPNVIHKEKIGMAGLHKRHEYSLVVSDLKQQ